jgi:cytochrome c-type biogenesis protein CcmH
MRPLFASLVLALVLAFAGAAEAHDGRAPAASGAAAPRGSAAPGEAIVEGRLLAPCCYMQTLDVHESPLATELRLEVRQRLAAGEAPTVIEDDFAARYGERVRAVPKGRDPRGNMFAVAIGVLLATALALGLLVRRWRRTPGDPPGPSLAVASGERDRFDDRVDELLHDLDG